MRSSEAIFHLRKVTDIHREYALFELLADDVPILDMGFSDDGLFELAFNEGIDGFIVAWDILRDWIEKGRLVAEDDRAKCSPQKT